MQVIPAILPHSFEELIDKLERVDGLVPLVQIDICDGIFGREKTWIPQGDEKLPESFLYQFDIMVDKWRPVLLQTLTLGPASIVMHVDLFTDEDINDLATIISSHTIPLGISVSNEKMIDFHADMIYKMKEKYPNIFIQVMGIRKVGEQGLIFDEETQERIRNLKKQFGDIKLQVDGGMSPETARLVVHDGAEAVVVGSYIFGSEDAGEALKNFEIIDMEQEEMV